MHLAEQLEPIYATADQSLAQTISLTHANMATNGGLNHSADQFQSASSALSTTSTAAPASDQASPSNNNLGKDEVAWFFVEQYYTTLSKTPEKLHVRDVCYHHLPVRGL